MADWAVDRALVKRAQRGDRHAFDLLVRKYQHRLAGLVSRFVFDPAEVEDVTQEAFIKAYRSIAEFRGDSAFYTWLYRIGVNTAKNHLASQRRRPPASGVKPADAEELSIGWKMRDNATPDAVLMRNRLAEDVRHMLGALPDDLRAAITLREIDGLTYEEIAQVMDCPIGTVRSRLFRAREAIDAELQVLLNSEPPAKRSAV